MRQPRIAVMSDSECVLPEGMSSLPWDEADTAIQAIPAEQPLDGILLCIRGAVPERVIRAVREAAAAGALISAVLGESVDVTDDLFEVCDLLTCNRPGEGAPESIDRAAENLRALITVGGGEPVKALVRLPGAAVGDTEITAAIQRAIGRVGILDAAIWKTSPVVVVTGDDPDQVSYQAALVAEELWEKNAVGVQPPSGELTVQVVIP